MNNLEILKRIDLGESVAEREQKELENYFIKTEAWEMLNQGRFDIIYGGKGTGKSALYLLLQKNAPNLFKRNIYLIPGEEISGDPVFQSVNEKGLSEDEFRSLWKIYILSLIGNSINRDEKNKDKFKPIL